jgi:hypothetical protein
MNITTSNICSAFGTHSVIGSKVTNHTEFSRVLLAAVAQHDFTQDRIPGQGFILIPEAIPFVSSGVGRPTENPDDYTLHLYRGRVSAFLLRERAAVAESCAVVIYTRQAYLDDPDVTIEEAARVAALDLALGATPVTHVLVAVLASSGPRGELTPYRFTANLAGGNHEAQVWTADEIRAKAKDIMGYDDSWTTVADPV